MSISVDIEKKLGSFHLRVQFEAGDETLALLGASGSGKSMTLKCIAGIEKPDRGRIVVDDVVLFDSEKHINLTPQQRRTGLMFQNYALFPNMTVLQNIRAGASREPDRRKREAAVAAVMDSFGLAPLAGHLPSQLSGGQQQRTALARILVSNPRILLLDEPFSALDNHLRFRLEQEVRRTIADFGKTVLLVSHDRDEVFRLSDSIAVINDGAIDAFGTKAEVFSNPGTRKGAILTGCKNISAIEVLENGQIWATDWDMVLEAPPLPPDVGAVGIRMHDIRPGPGKNGFRCQVVAEIENPFSYTVMLKPKNSTCGCPIGWEMNKDLWRKLRSDEVGISLPPEALLLLREMKKTQR
ncbi:MAG: sulfate/molybdate ABC transporter ATP-binding protein [Faecousia sp.]